jgi:V8-like Glu-specific endopeptidase
MRYPNGTVDARFLATTPIQYDGDSEHATGFFFSYNNEPYLVTNKHVVNMRSVNGKPLEKIRIHTRPNMEEITATNHHDLKLIDDSDTPYWHSHPEDSTIDVAVVPLTPPVTEEVIVPEQTATNFLKQDSLPRAEELIVGGRSIVLFGYPIRAHDPYYPVARDGLISSPYGPPNKEKPLFITDARTHGGLSGAPVFTHPSAIQSTHDRGFEALSPRKAFYLIGIHSNTSFSAGPVDALDLNDAWYSTLLLDIFESF